MGTLGLLRAAPFFVLVPVALAYGCSDDAAVPSSAVEQPISVDAPERVDSLFTRFGVPPAPVSRGASTVRVALPVRADEAVELEDLASGVAVRFALYGARPVALARDGDRAFGAAAHARGGDLVLRRHAHGVEDFVYLPEAPPEALLGYDVDVSRVAGLRLADDVLELLDATGTPRLRMERPWLSDASGRKWRAKVSVEGCAHALDSQPFMPVEAPGRKSCRVSVRWSDVASELEYPVLVDPNWSTTANNMSSPRTQHTATALNNGKVLVVGGSSGGSVPLASADLFDPTTNTFAVAKPLATARFAHAAVRIGVGAAEKVVVSGGVAKPGAAYAVQKSTEIYDVTTNAWAAGADMTTTRYAHAMAAYPQNNQILASGGYQFYNSTVQSSAELWNGTTWTAANPMSNPRAHHRALAVKTSEIWLVGGYTGVSGATGSVDSYVGVTRTAATPMVNAHDQYAATVLPNGTLLVHTGNGVGISAEYFDGLKWNVISQEWRRNHGAWTLSDGTALVAGHKATALRFDPATQKFHTAGSLLENRYYFAGANLQLTNRVLITGGVDPANTTIIHSDGEIFALTANGGACASHGECASLKCVEGVCCNSDCTGTCQSCVNAKTGGASGTCAPVKAGTDPDNDCAADAQTTCGNDGMCDAAGACRKWAAGTQCGSSCVSGTQTTLGCNGAGSCSQASSSKSCGGPPCANAQVCSTTCGAGSPCQPGYWCDAGTCKTQLAKGAACTADGQCGTGHCVDGICCDQACTGLCQACKAASKGYGANGDCGFVKDGIDVDNECSVDATNSCGDDGVCNGAGVCRKAANGTACGTAACQNATTASASTCNGFGVCQPSAAGAPCEPYRCDSANGKCKTTCTALADCAPGNYCELGLCVSTKIFGVPCNAATECLSGFCVDGVCCDAQCGGQCEACAETGNLGKCTTVSGAPRGNRTQCNGTGLCQGKCDGTDKNACSYPGAATACGAAASCTGDVSLPQGSCDGTGACSTPGNKSCVPYACDSASGGCKSACASDADCAQGSKCDTTAGKCAISGASCKDSVTLQLPNGQTESCLPYKCSGGACDTTCGADTDCASGYACEAPTCVASTGSGGAAGSTGTGGGKPASGGDDGGGCGCRVIGERRTDHALLLLALVAPLLGLRRRARRPRRDPR